ncbi:MAG: NAD-dependent epimerase [Marinilabiliales bacterium]|nr:MAG: NAD-dependent epimerase [Marinilabiliales bacterium]
MILVTGGTGLVGAHLLLELLKKEENIFALKRPSSDLNITKRIFSYYTDDFQNIFDKINWIDGDILDYQSIIYALKDITKVYHCAAAVSFQSSDKQTISDTNRLGTANLVNACLETGIEKMLHVSSIGALGRAGITGIVNEESQWNSKKTSVYSTSKYHAEMEVWRGIAEGLNAVIVNPSIIIGPADWSKGSAKLFDTMYHGLKFYTRGSNGFVDVEDVVKLMIIIMESDISAERFIINAENVPYKQFFSSMAKALNVKPPQIEAKRFLSEIAWRAFWVKSLFTGKQSSITKETAETANQTYQYSNKKVVDATSYKFMSIEDSIKKTAAFYLKDLNN